MIFHDDDSGAGKVSNHETTLGEGSAARITPSCCHVVQCPDTGYGPICIFLPEAESE